VYSGTPSPRLNPAMPQLYIKLIFDFQFSTMEDELYDQLMRNQLLNRYSAMRELGLLSISSKFKKEHIKKLVKEAYP